MPKLLQLKINLQYSINTASCFVLGYLSKLFLGCPSSHFFSNPNIFPKFCYFMIQVLSWNIGGAKNIKAVGVLIELIEINWQHQLNLIFYWKLFKNVSSREDLT